MNRKYHLLTALFAMTTFANIYGQNTKGIRAEYSELAKKTPLPVIPPTETIFLPSTTTKRLHGQ